MRVRDGVRVSGFGVDCCCSPSYCGHRRQTKRVSESRVGGRWAHRWREAFADRYTLHEADVERDLIPLDDGAFDAAEGEADGLRAYGGDAKDLKVSFQRRERSNTTGRGRTSAGARTVCQVCGDFSTRLLMVCALRGEETEGAVRSARRRRALDAKGSSREARTSRSCVFWPR